LAVSRVRLPDHANYQLLLSLKTKHSQEWLCYKITKAPLA